MTITSDTGSHANQTQQEIKDELTRQLAIKLRQFDRCVAENPSDPSGLNGNSPAGPARSAGPSGSAVAQGEPGGQNQPNSQAPGEAGNTGTEAEALLAQGVAGDGSEQSGSHSGESPASTAMETTNPGNSSSSGGTRRAPGKLVEDDVARILREAAEKETDPARRAALWAEYDNYVKNL